MAAHRHDARALRSELGRVRVRTTCWPSTACMWTTKTMQKLKEYDIAVAVARAATRSWAWAWLPSTKFMRAGLRLGLGNRLAGRNRLHRHAHRDAHRYAGAARGERGRVPGFGHHAGDGHHRRRSRALAGRQDRLLEIGKLADIIAVDLSGSHQTPTTDPVSAVVNTCSGADIPMTMVNGTALYEMRRTNGTWASRLPGTSPASPKSAVS